MLFPHTHARTCTHTHTHEHMRTYTELGTSRIRVDDETHSTRAPWQSLGSWPEVSPPKEAVLYGGNLRTHSSSLSSVSPETPCFHSALEIVPWNYHAVFLLWVNFSLHITLYSLTTSILGMILYSSFSVWYSEVTVTYNVQRPKFWIYHF